jgi:hypothetical protein
MASLRLVGKMPVGNARLTGVPPERNDGGDDQCRPQYDWLKRKISLRADPEWLWALNSLSVSADGLPLTSLSASLDEASSALGERWKSWLAWARLKEVD